MPISVTCTGCQKKYQVPDKLAGRAAKCQACGATLSIPKPQPAPKQDDDAARMADLFDEEFVPGEEQGGAAAIKECPICSAATDASALLCVECGYNFKKGKQLAVKSDAPPEPEPVAENPYESPSGAPSIKKVKRLGRSSRKGLKVVRVGLEMVFWSHMGVSIGAGVLWLMVFIAMMKPLAVMFAPGERLIAEGVATFSVILLVVAGVTAVVGQIVCLFTPSGSGRRYVVASLVLLLICVTSPLWIAMIILAMTSGDSAQGARMTESLGMLIVIRVIPLFVVTLPPISWCCFVVFLRELAMFVRRNELRDYADTVVGSIIRFIVTYIGVAFLVWGIMYLVISNIEPGTPREDIASRLNALRYLVMCGQVIVVVVAAIAMYQYAVLVWRIKGSIKIRG
jgi:hypothetical protein